MNDLLRELAPIPDAAWEPIEAEARRTLELAFTARRVVEFDGPKGWAHAAVATGRTTPLSAPGAGVEARQRRVLPLVELRVPFRVRRQEIDVAVRGGEAPELRAVAEAALALAHAEDRAVFAGWAEAGIEGICSHSDHPAVSLPADATRYPDAVAQAVGRLRDAGVAGPYALVLGPRAWTALLGATGGGGYPIERHVSHLVEQGPLRGPALDGGAVLSLRGGDFRLTVGRDASIGYLLHDDEAVLLHLEESFTFELLGPEAAVPLVHEDASASAGGTKG